MERVRLAILTISDSVARGERRDESGATIEAWAGERDYMVADRATLADDQQAIALRLATLADDGAVDLILTTGGTGFSPRDHTPEATREVIEREAPGVAEVLRLEGAASTRMSWLSRGVAGIRGGTLIVNLPGSPSGVREGLAVLDDLVPHAVQLLRDRDTERHPTHG